VVLIVTIPSRRDLRVTRARAAAFGRNPSSLIAASTRSLVAGATWRSLFTTRDTVFCVTPARAATSCMETRRGGSAGISIARAPLFCGD
jgi:hypothetical protein